MRTIALLSSLLIMPAVALAVSASAANNGVAVNCGTKFCFFTNARSAPRACAFTLKLVKFGKESEQSSAIRVPAGGTARYTVNDGANATKLEITSLACEGD